MSKICPQASQKSNQPDKYICNPITGNWIKIGSATHISLIKNGVLSSTGTVAETITGTVLSPLKIALQNKQKSEKVTPIGSVEPPSCPKITKKSKIKALSSDLSMGIPDTIATSKSGMKSQVIVKTEVSLVSADK